MRLLVPKKERLIKMKQLRSVSKLEKIIFPILVTLVVGILLPDALPLLGMLMLGNILRESCVAERLSSQAQNGLMNTVTIFLGVCVGSKAFGDVFLTWSTIKIILLGLMAFVFATIGGLLMGRLMCKLSKGKDQSPDRKRGRIGGAYGGAYFRRRRAGSRPEQSLADARYGA